MKVTLTITKSHIKNGCQNDEQNCPIALAILDKGYRKPDVETDRIKFQYRGHRCWKTVAFPTPSEAEAFITQFDDGKPVQSFRLTLEN